VFASSVVVVFLFGLISGYILAVIVNALKKTICACQKKTPESPTDTPTAFQNGCYSEVPINSPRSPAEFKIGQQ